MSENLYAPAGRWDAVARQALGLLEESGLTAARAAALFNIGSVLLRRGDQGAWAIECLRLGRRLWIELGDEEGRLAATENLAIALQQTRDGRDEAEELIAEALERYKRAGAH
ncbi:hypothetical protein [Paractinoplanes lichenicola]|uniref:MalT-like TPR region domain-containing protein n=1 Tax=Paractinoplanes lichenicola TaxID=2802976 RepID=A0ABS1VUJ4_9ACTN|nr:hypothetical protein [Actinoplanes lichenicola]MBL7258099.1 hypothetical protein [Actinoplanes lichenicola]